MEQQNHKQPHVVATQRTTWWKRVRTPWSWVATLRGPDRRIVGTLLFFLALGLALVLMGALVPPARDNGWVPVIGGTLFGASVAALFSFASARYSVLEGYRKEANLKRKEEIYGPLHAELKRLREQLTGAQRGARPYPQWIDIAGEPYPEIMILRGFAIPTLHLWPDFRSDYRSDSFTPLSQHRLDATLTTASAYNKALHAVRPIARAILQEELRTEVANIVHSAGYQKWYHQYEEQVARHVSWPEIRGQDETHMLYAAIAYGTSASSVSVEEAWASGWLEALPDRQPETLGWVLAMNAQQAAHCVHGTLKLLSAPALAPLPWYTAIFTRVCDRLANEPAMNAVTQAAEQLRMAVSTAEEHLVAGLAYIRERYEGGEPPV